MRFSLLEAAALPLLPTMLELLPVVAIAASDDAVEAFHIPRSAVHRLHDFLIQAMTAVCTENQPGSNLNALVSKLVTVMCFLELSLATACYLPGAMKALALAVAHGVPHSSHASLAAKAIAFAANITAPLANNSISVALSAGNASRWCQNIGVATVPQLFALKADFSNMRTPTATTNEVVTTLHPTAAANNPPSHFRNLLPAVRATGPAFVRHSRLARGIDVGRNIVTVNLLVTVVIAESIRCANTVKLVVSTLLASGIVMDAAAWLPPDFRSALALLCVLV